MWHDGHLIFTSAFETGHRYCERRNDYILEILSDWPLIGVNGYGFIL